MTTYRSKVRTALSLGLPNIVRVAVYRAGIKLGINLLCKLHAQEPKGPFFIAQSLPPVAAPPVFGWETSAMLFSYWPITLADTPPDWLANPLTGKRISQPQRVWWKLPDFDPDVGDIKLIWELSRMDWVLAFAQRARNGDRAALERLNTWLADWCQHNLPYRGPNWKCGQEASLRVMHLAVAAMILEQVQKPAIGLRDLVQLHLQRIAPTVQYAMAQDNNHGTSEAAALFIGGSWLAALGITDGAQWALNGRRWLENRAARLIGPHGSFSQYSLNYHRVMLDTFCMVEVWRRRLGLPAFSALWQERALYATRWLHHMVNPINGDGPNVGANDGARLLQLTDTIYRDYRPSVQLAMALFSNTNAMGRQFFHQATEKSGTRGYEPSAMPWNYPLVWLGIQLPTQDADPPGNLIADDGGFAILRRGAAMVMLRYPRFNFRPSQADALHLDLWLSGDNLLRDAGSYSYNAGLEWLNYFGGTASHNTLQFDNRDQMPRVSRFLFGDWLKTSHIHPLTEDHNSTRFSAGYSDIQGVRHHRRVSLFNTHVQVVDDAAGFANSAMLRWRLKPGDWQLSLSSCHELSCRSGAHTITVQATMPIKRCEIVQGLESRHYLEKKPVPVMEIEFQESGSLTTEYRWDA